MATQDLFFNIFARDQASDSFARLGRVARASAGDVSDLGDRLNAIGRQVARPEIKLKDDKAKAEMDDIRLKLARLSRVVSDPKITVEGALRASLQIRLLEDKLKDLQNASSKSGGPLRSLTGWLTGGGGLINGLKGANNAGSGFLSWIGSVASAGPAGIAVLAGLAGAAVEAALALAPVAAALIPVTIGFGGLAAVAGPEVVKVFQAIGEHGKKLQATLKTLTPAERDLVRQTEPLKDKFGELQKAVQPQIINAFAKGIKIVKDLMPALEPLIKAAARALNVFLQHMINWLQSPQGQSFVNWLKTTGPKDIKNFGRVMWDTAHTVGDALHAIYAAGSWVDRLVTHWKLDWYIMGLVAKIALDKVAIFGLNTVNFLLNAFSHLPGPLGAPFRAAQKDISEQLAKINADVANSGRLISDAWAAIHGKTVHLNFDMTLPAGVHETGGGQKTGRAAGWLVPGHGRGDTVPAMLEPGEAVVPRHLTPYVAPFLRAHSVPGFASGGLIGVTDKFRPHPAVFARKLTAAGNAAERGIILFVDGHSVFTGGFFGGTPGPGGGTPLLNAELAFTSYRSRMGPGDWAAWNYVAMRESGWNQFATNPASGAYGIPQALPFSKMPRAAWPAWAGGSSNVAAQESWMWNYMAAVYGGPKGAAAHERAFSWYGNGLDAIFNKRTLIGVGDRPEHVQVTPLSRGRTGNHYTINVNIAHGGSLREAGRQIVNAVLEFERGSGKSWRA